MSQRLRGILTEAVPEHPAVKAWRAATSLRSAPACVHVFSSERRPSAVYKLPGLGVREAAVWAKRSPISTAILERTIYEEILPQLPLTAPRYYGMCIAEPYGWVFVGDVGNERYSRAEPTHSQVAGQWVGTLHVGAAQIAAGRSLPDAGPTRYLRHLREGRENIRRSLRTWPFPPGELAVQKEAVAHADAIEARWDLVEAACQGAPRTLVHGDFQPKNVYVRREGTRLSLLLIDWEKAGFGSPAADLTRIDLRTYWSTVKESWPEVTFDTVERLANGGCVLQWLAAIDWESSWLKCESAADRSGSIVRLRIALDRLAVGARAIGLLD